MYPVLIWQHKAEELKYEVTVWPIPYNKYYEGPICKADRIEHFS